MVVRWGSGKRCWAAGGGGESPVLPASTGGSRRSRGPRGAPGPGGSLFPPMEMGAADG